MFIVSKTKSSQQCQQTEKNQTILPKSCDENYFISLALKRFLTDTGVINKQKICPTPVNTALQKLTKNDPFYSDTTIDNK